MKLIYGEMPALARRYMHRERTDHTLQPKAQVHETFLRLMQGQAADWQSRAHFATASVVMRQILVDHARAHIAGERPDGKHRRVDLDALLATQSPRIEELQILDQALTRLGAMDARHVRLIESPYLPCFRQREAAEVLGLSIRRVKRDWASARAWLQSRLGLSPR